MQRLSLSLASRRIGKKKVRYRMSERCQICGKEYDDYVWSVSDKLWEKVTGIKNASGLRCIPCFSCEAREKGIIIQWYGKEMK